uniref:Uncharacterized protein n=1 Tax=Arundo donax TaxID=35708 RepID=A0A0A9EJT5_ARUDO
MTKVSVPRRCTEKGTPPAVMYPIARNGSKIPIPSPSPSAPPPLPGCCCGCCFSRVSLRRRSRRGQGVRRRGFEGV